MSEVDLLRDRVRGQKHGPAGQALFVRAAGGSASCKCECEISAAARRRALGRLRARRRGKGRQRGERETARGVPPPALPIHTAKMSTTLPLFWDLSAASKQKRLKASSELITALERFQLGFEAQPAPPATDDDDAAMADAAGAAAKAAGSDDNLSLIHI